MNSLSDEKLIVVIAGQPGSGKTTLANSLVESYGFDSRNVGDELARLYRTENGLPDNSPVGGRERMPMHKKVRHVDPGYFTRYCLDGDYQRRAIDGLRNLRDAREIVAVGGYVVSLVAPQACRIARRASDTVKDPDLEALIRRELDENNDTDIDGAQTEDVMKLASSHGFYVDANQDPLAVLNDTLAGFIQLGVKIDRPETGQQR